MTTKCQRLNLSNHSWYWSDVGIARFRWREHAYGISAIVTTEWSRSNIGPTLHSVSLLWIFQPCRQKSFVINTVKNSPWKTEKKSVFRGMDVSQNYIMDQTIHGERHVKCSRKKNKKISLHSFRSHLIQLMSFSNYTSVSGRRICKCEVNTHLFCFSKV